MKGFKMLIVAAFLLLFAGNSYALPLVQGPFISKFQNWEMFSERYVDDGQGNVIDNWNTAGQEDNWGIIRLSEYTEGTGSYESIARKFGPSTWSDGALGVEITGLFYGIDIVAADVAGGFLGAVGGYIDIYANPLGSQSFPLDPDERLAFNQYDGITNVPGGQLLLSLEFVPGVMSLGGTDFTVVSSNLEIQGDQPKGDATSYLRIIGGDWANLFDNEYFTLDNGLTAAFYNSNNFVEDPDSLFHVISDDPLRGYVVPEPSTMLLLGAGLLGLAAIGRKRFMQNG